eukprot:TRINITY_DN27471_c0_g1_i1.p1 TRINITY_DN27471_c0_g1~~TRINITY_DN27471_c0_g1_i1.p1  ORF type:complete len:1378 (+),score=457.58 TRINITY_DN27471_c0_g1_i1:174-4307(+)
MSAQPGDGADTRVFHVHGGAAPGSNYKKLFTDNVVITSKYSFTPWSLNFIIWKNLFTQFQRLANLYFLLVATLQLLPYGLSPTGRYTTILPLTLVLMTTLAKDAYEDWKRHVRDREVNAQDVKAWRGNAWTTIEWSEMLVGEIVKVESSVSGGNFPADLILLESSDNQGICNIETANLDGETNLKMRTAFTEPPDCTHLPKFNAARPHEYKGTMSCELPNKDLYKFEGTLIRGPGPKDRFPIGTDAMLLRGSKLGGSTKWIIGLAVYTGKQTKLVRNQQEARYKKSTLELATNKQILYVFSFLLVLVVASAVGLAISTATSMGGHWYLASGDLNPYEQFGLGLATFLILFNNLIPISLYVSMELVKIVQAKLMNWDLEMYYEPSDTPAEARTSSVNEELGQIQSIFSDKTGTLTCNIMDFMKFSVGTHAYGSGVTEIARATAEREGRTLVDPRPSDLKMVKGFCFYDERVSDMAGDGKTWNWMQGEQAQEIGYFLKHLAVCHTVVTNITDDGLSEYTAASPDDVCLVTGVKYLGVEFVSRDAVETVLNVHSPGGRVTEERWKLLEVFEFSSDRKRMSIITRDPSGKLRLLCKGADSIIFELLAPPKDDRERHLRGLTFEYLKQFGSDGLRTLCIAEAVLDEQEYAKWQPIYRDAAEAVGKRDEKLAAAAAMMEKNLTLLGTTAIEDKLQEGVAATIEVLRTAGVNVWVLTGDKEETAINIGFACALLNQQMEIFKFGDLPGAEKARIAAKLREFSDMAKSLRQRNPNHDIGCVIQGNTLLGITGEDAPDVNRELFLELTACCKSVVCCRVSPGQKAEVVRLIKTHLKQVTLSIGDGANDVAMINEAHVGIGISGLEGLQAARASDYSIGQFRYLQRLLLIHGRWSYKRVSRVILYSFYKNMLLYLTQFWYCLFNFFTGQSLYDRWSLSGFNVAFAAFPVLAVGVFDRDIEPERILSLGQFPELYDEGRTGQCFNFLAFWGWSLTAIMQSAVCFFIPMLSLGDGIDSNEGGAVDMFWLGATAYTSVVWVVTLKSALITTSWTWVNHLTTWGSVFMWYVFLLVYGHAWTSPLGIGPEWYRIYEIIFADPKHYFVVIITVSTALFRDYAWMFAEGVFKPTLLHIVRAWEAMKRDEYLQDFNYNLMKRVHPHVLPRPRIKDKKKRRKAAPEGAPPGGPAPPPAGGTWAPGPAKEEEGSLSSPLIPQGAEDNPRVGYQQQGYADQGYHHAPHHPHYYSQRAGSYGHPVAPDPYGYPYQHGPPGAYDQSFRPHFPAPPPPGPWHGHGLHTGYAFSHGEAGDQIQLMASRIPHNAGAESIRWAPGYRPMHGHSVRPATIMSSSQMTGDPQSPQRSPYVDERVSRVSSPQSPYHPLHPSSARYHI